MDKFKLTIEMMEINQDTIIKSGTCPNSLEGLFMTRSDIGKELRWILLIEFKGWKVYTHWSDHDDKWILDNGDKVIDKRNLLNILEFNDEVWERYKF